MTTMEAPPMFRLSPEKARPLHPLSPERINAARTISTTTTTSKSSRTTELDSDYDDPPRNSGSISLQSSPTRKANLFADYHPTTPKQTASGFALPQSPSLPDIHTLRGGHVRTNSDVQGLVKRFEHLDVRDRDAESVERSRKHDAELRRALIAREEAESDVKRYREELRRLKRDGEESRERERKVARRLEVVMDEYASAKEQYASQSTVYEKELRRARKEAYKSSSAVIKLQEELKSTRNSLRITQSGFDVEKQKVQRREQETFNAQYQLAAVQEELDKLRAHLNIAEEEKVALKQSLKDEEVARVAAEGMIALPASQEDDDLFSSPTKRSPLSDDKENAGPVAKKGMESKRLEERLHHEQLRREYAEEMTGFLQMECKFRCCTCQMAGKQQGHDKFELSIAGELSAALDGIVESMKAVLRPLGKVEEPEEMDVEQAEPAAEPGQEEVMQVEEPVQVAGAVEEQPEPTLDSSPAEDVDRSMTMTADDEAPVAPHPTPATVEPEPVVKATDEEPLQPSSRPQTPTKPQSTTPFRPQFTRTITTTTTVPMHFTPMAKPHTLQCDTLQDAENIPPTPLTTRLNHGDIAVDGTTEVDQPFDRAAALAAIEYRRGRAKSFQAGHMTPRKQMLEGVNQRRDISAPALGGKVGGVNFAKGAGSVGRAGRRMV